MGHRPSAVGRGDYERFAVEPIGRVVFRRIAQVKALHGQTVTFTAQDHLARGKASSDPTSFFDLGARNHFPDAGGHGMNDGGRRAKDVDHDDGATRQFFGIDQLRQGVNV